MRFALVPLALALVAAPVGARAELRLRLARLGDAPAEHAPSARLDLPALQLSGLDALRVDTGAGARGSETPALALILGIIPGFGLGHLIANSPRWTTWLLVDVVLVAVWVVGAAADVGDPFDTLMWVVTIVERIFEGIDAFRSAGGRFASRDGDLPPSALAVARPVRDPGAAGFAVARF
jgi:hypothetical protein